MAKDIDLVTGRGAAPDSGMGEGFLSPTPAKAKSKPPAVVNVAVAPACAPAREDADIIMGSHVVGTTGTRVHDVEQGCFKIIGGNWGYKGKAYYSGCTYPVGDIDVEVLKKFPKQIALGG